MNIEIAFAIKTCNVIFRHKTAPSTTKYALWEVFCLKSDAASKAQFSVSAIQTSRSSQGVEAKKEKSNNKPLKLLKYFTATNPVLWESVLTLRDHNVERRHENPNLWRESQEAKVATFVVNVCNIPGVESIAEVHRVMGILATNSANLDLQEGFGKGYALYPSYAKVNHNCFSNTKNLNHLAEHQ